jgi:predicted ATPase/DNA-binding SARP family transcriptional activator
MARLSLSLLGSLRIALDGQLASGFAYNKARALLAYLAVKADRPHQRDALVGLLWPELSDTAARSNLRQALANLREAIGDASATPPFLHITRDIIQFNPTSNYDLDVATFGALLTACKTHTHRHLERCRSCAARMEQAIALYHGDFLAEFSVGGSAPFEEWQLRQRERLHRQALDVLAHLADYFERRGEDELGRRYAQRQIELEPWREEAHRQLMRLLAHGGQRSAALAQYETCRRILARDLGVEPEAATIGLYERIRDTASAAWFVQTDEAQHLQNFPAQTTMLIGREAELAELGTLLEDPACRLITIAGPGGIGKTRLVLAAAVGQAEVFANGAAFVPLQAISSAAFVAPTILAALDVPLQGQRDPREQLLDALRNKELLLVLDNVEQLLAPDQINNDSIADLLSALLARAPGVTLLVTSRARLALPGEWLFDLSGLSFPSGELVNGIEGYSAVRLFIQRAGQVRRQFALAEGEARAVARICQLVEGLPLAIELAAAALRTRSTSAIATAIESNLSTLAIELRAVPERHRSMWATFEHSWRLLSDEERQVFARLSVFRGGFEEDAAAKVAQATPKLLAALLDKSLLRWDGVARYDVHELVRQYADEKLEQAGEAEAVLRRHAEYFVLLAEKAEPEINGPQLQMWLNRLEANYDNVRAVLAWSLRGQHAPGTDEQKASTLGLRLAGALPIFWTARNRHNEGLAWIDSSLERNRNIATSLPPSVRMKALNAAGYMAVAISDHKRATALLEESVILSRDMGDYIGVATALVQLGRLARTQGDYGQAERLEEEGLALFRSQGDTSGITLALLSLSDAALEQGALDRATGYLQEALAICQDVELVDWILWVTYNLGRVAHLQGDHTRALSQLEESLTQFRDLDYTMGVGNTLTAMARVAHVQGDDSTAAQYFAKSLALLSETPFSESYLAALEGLAGVSAARGQPERAARLFGTAETQRESRGMPLPPAYHAAYEHDVAAARAELNEATFAAAWAAGRAMTLEQAIAYALEGSQVDAVSSTAATTARQ